MLECYQKTKAFSPFLSLKENQTNDDPFILCLYTPQLIPYETCVCILFFKQEIHMYLPEDVFQKEVSHRLSRPARLSHEKVNNNQFLYTNSVMKKNHWQRQATKCQGIRKFLTQITPIFYPSLESIGRRGELIDDKTQSKLQNNKTN